MSAPIVSDTALLRFIERGYGLDVEAMRAAIAETLRPAHEAAIGIGSTEHLVVAAGHAFVIRSGVVKTVSRATNPMIRARVLAAVDHP